MGSPITSWDGAEAVFTGAGSAMPGLFLILSIAMVLGALWWGARHESEAYERISRE
ncbi:MAG: hypothetical protein ACK4Y4_08095 [Brevundimonas sp.]